MREERGSCHWLQGKKSENSFQLSTQHRGKGNGSRFIVKKREAKKLPVLHDQQKS